MTDLTVIEQTLDNDLNEAWLVKMMGNRGWQYAVLRTSFLLGSE